MQAVEKELQRLKSPAKAKILARFFKTGKGQYGEGDVFLGIKVPLQRQIAKKFSDLPLADIQKLLNSQIHEYRLTALFILILQFRQADKLIKQGIYNFYLENTKNINNWDLVDLSAPNILGEYLQDKNRKVLCLLANSKNLWEKRIAMLATYTFIKNKDFQDSLKISRILLKDKHDLIHKAVGWMLREIGKRDIKTLENFLEKNYSKMSRVTLRYSLEKFNLQRRNYYLQK